MTVFDLDIRVEMNSHGGVVLHIPACKGTDGFVIWNRVDGKWGVTGKDNRILLEDGTWASEGAHGFVSPADAFWKGMGWGETVTKEQTIGAA